MEIGELLNIVIEEGASDLHIVVGRPPVLRIDGKLTSLEGYKELTKEDTQKLVFSITSPAHQQTIQERGGVDFGFAFGDVARFRVGVYKGKGELGMALRTIPSKFLTFEQIGLPLHIKELLHKPQGLVLVTGPNDF